MKCVSFDWIVMLAIQQLDVDTYAGMAKELGLVCHGELPLLRYVERMHKVGLLPPFVREEYRRLMFGEATAVTWGMLFRLYSVYSNEFKQYPNGNGPSFTTVWREYTI